MHSQTLEQDNHDQQSELTPDERLVEQVLSGDINAFELIMRRYNQRLYRVTRAILDDPDLAQDAIQQAYIKAYYKLYSYSPTGTFSSWLTKITINEALMIKRKPENRDSMINENNFHNLPLSEISNPLNIRENSELANIIESSIRKLPEEFRLVFVLRAVQSLSIKEVANSLDIKEATVKTRFHRARSIMQNNLNQYIEDAGLQVFEFAGKRCDSIVNAVLNKINT